MEWQYYWKARMAESGPAIVQLKHKSGGHKATGEKRWVANRRKAFLSPPLPPWFLKEAHKAILFPMKGRKRKEVHVLKME